MASAAAIAHARALLKFANMSDDDPRRTRIDLLQVGNYIAVSSAENPELRNLLISIRKFASRQVITAEDLKAAMKHGWPVIPALPGPVSYFYAGARLVAHTALRSRAVIDTFENSIKAVGPLSQRVMNMLDASEKDLFSAATVVAAETAAKSKTFRSRLIAGSKDIQQIITSNEFPKSADFRKADPANPHWPPLRLGSPPIVGAAFAEGHGDWDEGGYDEPEPEGGGAYVQASGTCTIPSGSTAADIACGVVVVVVILAAIAAVAKAA